MNEPAASFNYKKKEQKWYLLGINFSYLHRLRRGVDEGKIKCLVLCKMRKSESSQTVFRSLSFIPIYRTSPPPPPLTLPSVSISMTGIACSGVHHALTICNAAKWVNMHIRIS